MPAVIPSVVLKPKMVLPFYARHPWVFAGAVERTEGSPADGDEVNLVTNAGKFVARGLYNSRSKIVTRLYSWEPDRPLDADFFRGQFQTAIKLRDDLGLHRPGLGCRLVFSEADAFSGCIVDEYDGWLSMQFTALGLANRREMLAEILQELTAAKGVYVRTEKGVGQLEGLELQDGLLRGESPPPDLTFIENGLKLRVNIAEGQKTGYYHDQRDNRAAVAKLAKGRRVLDAFSYTGGFGLNCARAGAASVECLDVSEAALNLARENAELNGLTGMTFTKGDVFRKLDEYVTEGRNYDLVVLDPPKFARTRSAIPDAIKGYRHLLKQGLLLLPPGGILVMCCCSGLISSDVLTDVMAQAAAQAHRPVQLIEKRGPAPDHPTALSCLETSYLKCVIARVG
ncbi:class I SAM-dependent rRNA methyltransferase [Zavarzinella formosa]|uniref:class I SAM-dependent rRNA methyltransferase n=1 Tax=Zavarzinella formosa TaxID=360055 RepID=UPI00030ACCC4|nr:class I SAM-dependent rRNA methyltransferase [Zavarzinella formosa]